MKHTCTWCHSDFSDNVTEDVYNRGSKNQEVVVDDVPWLCLNCNQKAKDNLQ